MHGTDYTGAKNLVRVREFAALLGVLLLVVSGCSGGRSTDDIVSRLERAGFFKANPDLSEADIERFAEELCSDLEGSDDPTGALVAGFESGDLAGLRNSALDPDWTVDRLASFVVEPGCPDFEDSINDALSEAEIPFSDTGSGSTPNGAEGEGNAGATPAATTSFLAVTDLDPILGTVDQTTRIDAGLAICDGLDQGQSIGSIANRYIASLESAGASDADAEMAFYTLASAAAANGNLSFCVRHFQAIDGYNDAVG